VGKFETGFVELLGFLLMRFGIVAVQPTSRRNDGLPLHHHIHRYEAMQRSKGFSTWKVMRKSRVSKQVSVLPAENYGLYLHAT
jgi:hypothetical protein